MIKLFSALLVMSLSFSAVVQAATLLKPASAWMVGPTTVEDGAKTDMAGMPCVMVNEFTNDFGLRISGGNNEILAMAMTVGETPFEKDQSYLMTVGFEEDAGEQFPAEAFSNDTVVIGITKGQDFYRSLKDSEAMYITLGDSQMRFSLKGATQGLKRLEECYKPLPQVVTAPVVPPIVPEEISGIHTLGDLDGPQTSDIKASDILDQADGNALPPMEEVAVVTETITEPEVAPAAEIPLPVEAETLAELTKAPEPVAVPMPVKDVTPRDILVTSSGVKNTQEMRWRVSKGSDLQDVLTEWAKGAQVKLVWAADDSFSVQESLSMVSTFEDVVQLLLAQFPVDKTYPTGRFYVDPALQQKALVIENVDAAVTPATEGNYEPISIPN